VARYIAKRLALLIVIILFVSVAAFFLVHLLPGDPATTILGPNATAQNVATVNQELGLNKPLWQQYFIWMGHVLQGNLGQSFTTHQTTTSIISESFPIDLELIIFSQIIAFAVAFPIYINTYAAIRSIDPSYGELADVVGLGRWARIRRIVLPAALPGFLVGLRLAMAVAWLLLVFAEQINASSGLGYLIVQAQTYFQSNVIVVCLACYAVLGLLTDVFVRSLEAGLLRWQPGR